MKKFKKLTSMATTTILISSMMLSTALANESGLTFDNEKQSTTEQYLEGHEEITPHTIEQADVQPFNNLTEEIEVIKIKTPNSDSKLVEKKNINDISDIKLNQLPQDAKKVKSIDNSQPESATYLSTSMLNKRITGIADGYDAWYYFEIEDPKTKITANLSLVPGSDYDLELYAYDSTSGGALYGVVGSFYPSDWEENLGHIADTGIYFLRITPYQYSGTPTQFTFAVNTVKDFYKLSANGVTSTKSFDLLEANDNIWQATPIDNAVNVLINSDNRNDEDWFELRVNPTSELPYHTLSIAESGRRRENYYKISIFVMLDNQLHEVFDKNTSPRPTSGDYSPEDIWRLQFQPGVYYLRIKPTSYSSVDSSNNFRLRLTPNSGTTDFANDNFIQLGTTVQNYSNPALWSGTTYKSSVDYLQKRHSFITGEVYYALMKGKQNTGTKENVQRWLDGVLSDSGYRRFGTPVVSITTNY